jgi:hypothetical protein
MGDAEELKLLRDDYEHALASYEAVCLELNRYLIAGTRPDAADLARERDARVLLDTARRAYLDALIPREG